jgi:hypothetical protein
VVGISVDNIYILPDGVIHCEEGLGVRKVGTPKAGEFVISADDNELFR